MKRIYACTQRTDEVCSGLGLNNERDSASNKMTQSATTHDVGRRHSRRFQDRSEIVPLPHVVNSQERSSYSRGYLLM